MTRGFRNILIYAVEQQLIDNLLAHMPRKSQRILGKENLSALDILDLPRVPSQFLHRLTYLDIPGRVDSSNIQHTQTPYHQTPGKALRPGVQIEGSMGAKIYVGRPLPAVEGLLASERTNEDQAATASWPSPSARSYETKA
ncbi:hypothetical protein FALBO_7843 [Fusarium albosuccineum]|uniref:Uncharacterized protein n=1 Tax=Fusarium albosuccineum TaxID=1237068 RepID=A0A8H4LAJ9_9HYPO|nr:hypothetical protein FALBO_7843 [Fusarium albosuccineum]